MDNTNDNNTINPSEKTQLDPCACRRKGAKLEVYDWLSDIPESHDDTDLVEVRFKNTRKGYYRNTTHIKLAPGDLRPRRCGDSRRRHPCLRKAAGLLRG